LILSSFLHGHCLTYAGVLCSCLALDAGLVLDSEEQAAAAAAAEAAGQDPAELQGERERLVQQLHEQLQQMLDERQDDLKAAYKQLGLPEPEWSLGSVDGSDDSSSSPKPKQLTGR
jgi:hypothetical protein